MSAASRRLLPLYASPGYSYVQGTTQPAPRLRSSQGYLCEDRMVYEIIKCALDVVGAGALLLIALPLMIAIALGVKLSSPGPIFFRQRRLGRDGKVFYCYKFRSMVCDAEVRLKQCPELWQKFGQNYKLKCDPRVTSFGMFLRKTSLDELPQLWNVLRGDMSLIGPRPIVPPELDKYGFFGRKLLTVTPGLSGMWQVYGRSDTTYPERVRLDMSYIDARSTLLDIKLLLLTMRAVVNRSGAY